ncbi:MAG: hypothetical protein A2X56_15100 [Nitrospirae bacterium GWC2_57_13]|jgi:predicted HTH domain antitoxin|nr:MAG: hypothetical protein A2072_03175 [Nitrospirae bacterium GWC1_57_7]OGW28036.1 MAG: hypothetical protein A2X56_15100 [Nitrospirae bacterium GWC2_57_13]HAS53744.1 hypothetical protein [Nitrospiraceae bacterium]
MKTKSIRIPDDIQRAVTKVEKEEKVEEATAIRKLIKIGYETYVADRYRDGKLSLAEASRRLGITQSEMIDLLLERGTKGNLDAGDVLAALEAFAK